MDRCLLFSISRDIDFSFLATNDEPIHIHIEKAEGSAKYWLEPIAEVYSYGFTSRQRKEIKEIIESRIIDLKNAWNEYFK